EIGSGAGDFEPGALQPIPTQHTPHDDLKIPSADRLVLFSFERDEFRAAGVVAFCDFNLIQSRSNVRTRVTLQCAQQLSALNHVGPGRVWAGDTEFVAHTLQILRRIPAP